MKKILFFFILKVSCVHWPPCHLWMLNLCVWQTHCRPDVAADSQDCSSFAHSRSSSQSMAWMWSGSRRQSLMERCYQPFSSGDPGGKKMTALVILVQRLSIVVWQPMKYLLTKFVTVCPTPLLSLRLKWKPVEAHDQTYITFLKKFPKTKRTVKGSGFQSSDQTKTWYQRLQIYT